MSTIQCEFKTDNVLSEDSYEYNNESWKDQLTKFNNTEITYDQIGNPVTIGNQTLSWQNGRELKELKTPSKTINYTYNKDGIRKSKTINNVITNYFTENSALIFEETNNNMLYFIRDDNNKLLGFKYNDTIYYYQKNIQEDITGIYDSNYNLIATYEYDSWGKILSIKDNLGNDISTNSSHIANINPFRYRSYYYDKEVELYYLNSRYYNPEWGRFINVDEYVDTKQDFFSNNTYSYTENNPINRSDISGMLWFQIAGAVFGALISLIVTGGANLIQGNLITEGIIGSLIGGAMAGYLITTPFGLTTRGAIVGAYGSAFVTNGLNEIVSSIQDDRAFNTKSVMKSTIISGTISMLIPDPYTINKGWIRPQRLVTSFTGNYQQKIAINTLTNNLVSSSLEQIAFYENTIKELQRICDSYEQMKNAKPHRTSKGFSDGADYGGGNGGGHGF